MFRLKYLLYIIGAALFLIGLYFFVIGGDIGNFILEKKVYEHQGYEFTIIGKIHHNRFFVKNDYFVYLADDGYLRQVDGLDVDTFDYKGPGYFSDKNGVYYGDLFEMKLNYSDVQPFPYHRDEARKSIRLLNFDDYGFERILGLDEGFKSIEQFGVDLNRYATDKFNSYSHGVILNGVNPRYFGSKNHYGVKNNEKSTKSCNAKIELGSLVACCDQVLKGSNESFEDIGGIYGKDDISVYALGLIPENNPVCFPIDVDVDTFEVTGKKDKEIDIIPSSIFDEYVAKKTESTFYSKDVSGTYVSEIDLDICVTSKASTDYPIKKCGDRTGVFRTSK